MTRNNLHDHLTWLLANVAVNAPNALHLPSARHQPTSDLTSASNRPTIPRVQARPENPSEPFLYPNLPVTRPSRSVHAHTEQIDGPIEPVARPPNVPERDTVGGRMGMLSSRSGSKRPNLVLRQEQLLTPTSTSGAGSLAKEYTTLLKNSGSAANSAKKVTTPRRQFLTPGPTLGSDRTFDTVDLTKDDSLNSSNSVVFGSNTGLWREEFAARPGPVSTTTENSVAFGTDVMVWEEEHAARAEPITTTENSVIFGSDVHIWEEGHATRPAPLTPKRGTKRKSDQISQPPATTSVDPDEFPDICEILSDEVMQSHLKRSPTKSPAKSKLKTAVAQTPSRRPTFKKETAYPANEGTDVSDDSPFATNRTIKRSPTKSPRKDEIPRYAMKDAERGSMAPSGHDSAPKHRSQATKPRPNDDVIMDSDDEPVTPPSYAVPDSTARSGAHLKASARRSQVDDYVVAYDTPSQPKQAAQSERRTAFRSPTRIDQDSSLIVETTTMSFDHDTVAGPSQVSQPMSEPCIMMGDEEKYVILELFLAQPSVAERKRKLLEGKLQENRDAFQLSLKNRNLESRGHLKREKERLAQQQAALDDLGAEYRSYEEVESKKEALITRISDAYDQDLDTQEDEARLEELESVLKERRSSLKESLIKAGIDNRDLFESSKAYNAQGLVNPIVQATQPAKNPRPASFSRETTLIPRGGSQVILQTQLPQRSDNQPLPAQGYDEAPLPPQSPLRRHHRVPSTPPDFDNIDDMIDQQPPFTLAGNSKFTKSPSRHSKSTTTRDMDPHVFDDDDDDDDQLEDPLPPPSRRLGKKMPTNPQPASAKTRKSPAKAKASHEQSYQSDYSDDVDMVQFAEEFDRQSSSGTRQSKSHRPVLSETSGNAVARSQKMSAMKTTDPLMSTQIPRELKERPWFKDVRRALKDRFRMTGFRHNQLEAIDATLAGKDAFILMPTGGGKSLCYQLPAVITSGKTQGVTVVVSPLISLMHDQIDHLNALNIMATSYSGETEKQRRFEIMRHLEERHPEHHIQLLYVTPEMINKSTTFLEGLSVLYRNKKLARLVIDEAHCVSQWGHDFRPDYKELGTFRQSFPGVPLMALTATATQNVIMDVKHNLGIERCKEFSQSFNRPNLYYEVMRKEKDSVEMIADLINTKYVGQSGIVYTLARKSAERIAERLRARGIAASHYHASINPKEKTKVQKSWQAGRVKVVVATIAFGMGIDKPDVRFVIHQTIPKSLEGYYQETGRAGRDGKPSECYLFFSYGDVTTLRSMIMDGDGSEEQKERQKNMLSTVSAFCDNQSDCRRVEILRYFGESFAKEQCGGTCDNCLNEEVFEQKDFTEYAIAALRIVESQGKLTLIQCTDFLMGKKKVSDYKRGTEEYRGIAKLVPKHEIHRVVDRLLAEGALKEENIFNKKAKIAIQYFRAGPRARAFLDGRRQLLLTTRVKGKDSQGGASKRQTRISQPATAATKRLATGSFPSTNVSSPVLGKQRKGKGKAPMISDDEDSDEDYSRFSNGYAKDGFVVEDVESDNDDFETMSVPRSRRPAKRNSLGRPISHDMRMNDAELTELHDDILRNFLKDAKEFEENLRNQKSLRTPIFTEQQLREMAIQWTVSVEEMHSIQGINHDRVDRYGNWFLPLIRQYHERYREIMNQGSPRTAARASKSHNVVVVVSTDDEGMDDVEDLEEEDLEEQGATSSYFAAPAQRTGRGPTASRARSTSAAARSSRGGTWRGSKTFARKASGGSSRGGKSSYAGVKKKANANGRKTKSGTSSTTVGGQQTRLSGGASGSGGRGGKSRSGIGLMEH
ncbi:hypothetical protein GGR54DRAFT_155938 [Hypoxylon sp. NC1633]|nr:hypothetical protein GGR54DRAFT_155938 [Hypoxylon sp. NC1633]